MDDEALRKALVGRTILTVDGDIVDGMSFELDNGTLLTVVAHAPAPWHNPELEVLVHERISAVDALRVKPHKS